MGPSMFRKESATRARAEQKRCAFQAEVMMSTAVCSTMQMRWKLLWTAKELPMGVRARGSNATMLWSERKRRSML
eukprot:15956811-Heterocapsa_arctica.AAC.1